jgi:predicted transcriptional regulator
MKTISLRLPPRLERDLARRAEDRSLSRSDLIREALAEYLVEEPGAAPASFAALAEDLAGCADGPEDLSVNPEHLRQYGR